MSQRKRNAALTCGFVPKLDKRVMLNPLARLRGSALRGWAFGRAIVICSLAMTISFAGSEKISSAEADSFKPFNEMKDRKSTRLNSSHVSESRMPSSA